jgi:ATP-dependent DNA helicase RecQ
MELDKADRVAHPWAWPRKANLQDLMKPDSASLLALLKAHFGFSSFRPLQEEIIRDSLAGQDVFALLPTGGGKSLCYQLRALARPGLTVVVSPLIALMKDQVDALQANGIPATFLNSSLEPGEGRARLRGLHQGAYRLLFAAPERLMLSGFLDDLQQWNPNLIAVDEAHCISEWGHDFRPEYRQMVQLRERLPMVPMMALTATATERVREDILLQLQLKEPRCYVASFNRPNLVYRVVPKTNPYEQLRAFLAERTSESGIIYCQARKSAETLAERLNGDGFSARPYHAGLESKERTTHQELFLRDEVRVICATIAFGMGINKPNVRFVVHYDLPKNIEGYYQETGRAGRDGLPSECLLLFRAGDAVKMRRFIDDKPSPQEKQVARIQLDQMIHYAECSECRRSVLLDYFGETRREETCGGCDNCLAPRQTYDGTVEAQKLLSCVYRIREKSRFSVGLNHVVEVLTGADTEKIRRWGHQELTTYGIGGEHNRRGWAAIGRELIRLGHLRQLADKFNVLELTAQGRTALASRQKIPLTRPAQAPESAQPRAGTIACDEGLFEHLRAVRKRLADARNLPPYIVFSDVALRQMARGYPTTSSEFLRISGVGERKLREYGGSFLSEIETYLRTHPRQAFADDSFAPVSPGKGGLADTAWESLKRFRTGETIESIAQSRHLVAGTVYKHLTLAIEAGERLDLERFFDAEQQEQIEAAFRQSGLGNLSGAHEALSGKIDFDVLRIFRAARNQNWI